MKHRKKKWIAMLLLIVTIVALFPVRRSEAAPASIGVVGNTHITYDSDGKTLYEITVKNGSLHVKGEYYSNSSALLSYHTEYLYFTIEPTRGYPKTADKCYPVRVHDHIRTNSTTPGYVHDTYVIDAGTLEKVAERLFGDRNALKGGKTIYISEGYVLKRRSSATDPNWKYDTKELDTIDKIQNAAEWSDLTYYNFPNYYDIELKLDLTRYNVSASATEGGFVSGDMGTHYFGDPVTLVATANKENYSFKEWTVKSGTGVSLSNKKSERITFTMPQSNVVLEAVFVAPTPTPVPKVKFTLRTHYSLGDTEVDVETFNGEITKGGTYAGHQWYSPRTHDVPAYGLTGTKWNWIRSSSTGDIEVDGMKALSGPINQDSTVDMYYKITPTPTPTPKPAPAGKCNVYLNTHYIYNGVEVYVLRNTAQVTKGGTYKGWIWKSPRTSEYDGKKYQFDYSVLTGDVKGDGAMVVYESSPINQNSTVDMYYELNEPTGTPTPTVTKKPTPTPIPPRFEPAPQIVIPTAAPVPIPVLPEYSNIHEDECHTGYKHVHNNCYYPVYHSHTSSCYHTHKSGSTSNGGCYASSCDEYPTTRSLNSEFWCYEFCSVCGDGDDEVEEQYLVKVYDEFCGCGALIRTYSPNWFWCSYHGGTDAYTTQTYSHNKVYDLLNCGYYDDGPICGKTTSYVEYYGDCGRVEGYYYDGWTVCDPICDQVVTGLTPMYPKQTLQIGESPNVSAYATFMSSTGKHKDYPVYPVLCSMTGFDASLYNKWQTVTLSYGTYANSAKNKQPTTTTIQVYIAGEVTVSFDANGGTCSTASKTVTYGKSYGTLPVPTREDYAFWGWVYNDAHIEEDSVVATSSNHTLTAAWTPLKQTVSFDANGGTVTPTSKTVTYGKAYGTLPTPTRTGYTFDGWWYGDQRITDSTVVDAWKDHTLVADWLENTYKITLDGNGGSCTITSVNVKYNQPDNNSIDVQVTRPGYIYKGLWTAKTGGTQVYDVNGKWVSGTYWKNGTWSYPGNLTVYAQWEEKDNTICYAPNGGTGSMENDIYKVSVPTAVLKENTFTRKGYSFIGWNTEPDGSGTFYADKATITIPLGITTLYAQWEEGSYTLQVAKEEMGVIPVTIIQSKILRFSQSTTIPSALANKTYTLQYNVGDGYYVSPVTSENTTASLEFRGWELYRKTVNGYEYALNMFVPGETVSHLSEQTGDVMTLFPYWSGDASYVKLPLARKTGYNFIGWRVNNNENELITVTDSGTTYYKPNGNSTMHAYYEPKQYTVTFDWNFDWDEPGIDTNTNWTGETKTVTFDSFYGALPVPDREGYNFIGWYLAEDESGNGCGEEVTEDTYVTIAGNHTLYGKWEVAFKEAEVWLTSCAVYWRTKAIPEEEVLDPEEDVLEIREGGLSPLWVAVRVTGRFDYMTIEVPWESSIRTIDFDSAEYDRETDQWELPGFVEYVPYGEPVAFGERVYDPTMYYYEEGDEVLIGFIPHDAGDLSRWFEAMLRKDIVLFALWEDERMAEQPGWTDETYEIKVNFYGNDKLLQGYKVGVKFVSWDVWNQQILHGRDSATGGWM